MWAELTKPLDRKYTIEMEQHVFCIFIDYRGHHRKGVAILMPIMSIFNQNLGFNGNICIFGHYREVQKIKNNLIDIDFGHENIFMMTF
jgi:hypothetical protein